MPNCDSVFHWICHTLGIYHIQSNYGISLQFPNSIQLPLSMIQDPTNIHRYFLTYLFQEIRSCTTQYAQSGSCICGICSVYLQKYSSGKQALDAVLTKKRYSYMQYLRDNDMQYMTPFVLYQDFGLERKIPSSIVVPSAIPTFVLCAVGS